MSAYLWCYQAKSVWSQSNSVFIFINWLYATFSQLPFAENPIEISQLVPKIWAVEGCQKQLETKDIFCFVWFYLKINMTDFRLILLDYITSHLTNNNSLLKLAFFRSYVIASADMSTLIFLKFLVIHDCNSYWYSNIHCTAKDKTESGPFA